MPHHPITRALISVTDKTGVVEFARSLSEEFGVEIISTGGTARVLEEAGVTVRPIDDVTGFPEMMDGRVKTLHPKVHGGLLARRDSNEHLADAEENSIQLIDLVVVNLYEFEKTVADPKVEFSHAIENIDIGGPSMLRSAAKNHDAVTVVTDPDDYGAVLSQMRANSGSTTLETRRELALKVYRLTSAYDSAISSWLGARLADEAFSEQEDLILTKVQDLRYGENPHQKAAFYLMPDASENSLGRAEQLQGKELSYNNYLDTDACWAAVREFSDPAVVIVKHTNPCGVGIAQDVADAYDRAYTADPISAYGGIMAVNRTVTAELIRRVQGNKLFLEVIIAPDFQPEALELLATKKNLRVLKTGGLDPVAAHYEYRSVEGGMLVQEADRVAEEPETFTIPTKLAPTAEQMADLLFAWRVCKSVKSNAILLAKDGREIGMGAGQPNRVNSARIAIEQAGEAATDSVMASDAFIPFDDTIRAAAKAGVRAIIQPGGSIRDEDAIRACDEEGIAMVFTGHRHFKH